MRHTFQVQGVQPPPDWQGRKLGPGPAQKLSQEGAGALPGAVGQEAAVASCLDAIKLAIPHGEKEEPPEWTALGLTLRVRERRRCVTMRHVAFSG